MTHDMRTWRDVRTTRSSALSIARARAKFSGEIMVMYQRRSGIGGMVWSVATYVDWCRPTSGMYDSAVDRVSTTRYIAPEGEILRMA